MKTITDDPNGFFAQGGWTFLESDSGDGPAEGVVGDSDVEEDDYNPEQEDSAEEGSESEYSGEEDDGEDEFKDEESDSGIKFVFRKKNIKIFEIHFHLDASENLESDEESGKSWSELEEEARKGN
jgi:nucleosome binding factor SPN SPT16 subunit